MSAYASSQWPDIGATKLVSMKTYRWNNFRQLMDKNRKLLGNKSQRPVALTNICFGLSLDPSDLIEFEDELPLQFKSYSIHFDEVRRKLAKRYMHIENDRKFAVILNYMQSNNTPFTQSCREVYPDISDEEIKRLYQKLRNKTK